MEGETSTPGRARGQGLIDLFLVVVFQSEVMRSILRLPSMVLHRGLWAN